MAAKKKTPTRKVGTGKASGGKKYVCATCGAVTTSRGHLCTPVVLDKAVTCDYCGMVVGNPRHVCKPKAAKMAFYCDACGRTAARQNELCVPKKI